MLRRFDLFVMAQIKNERWAPLWVGGRNLTKVAVESSATWTAGIAGMDAVAMGTAWTGLQRWVPQGSAAIAVGTVGCGDLAAGTVGGWGRSGGCRWGWAVAVGTAGDGAVAVGTAGMGLQRWAPLGMGAL